MESQKTNSLVSEIVITPLADKKQVRGCFDREDKTTFGHLVAWLQTRAWQCQHEKTCKVFLATHNGDIVGYIAITSATVKLPASLYEVKSDANVILIGKLFVAEDYRSQGLGRHLLDFTLDLARTLDILIGCRGLIVDPNSNEGTLRFYKKFGFTTLDNDSKNQRMFFPLPA